MRTVMYPKDEYQVTMLNISKQNFDTLVAKLAPIITSESHTDYIVIMDDGTRSMAIEFFGLRIVFLEADPTGAEDDLFLMRKGATESPESESEEREYAA